MNLSSCDIGNPIYDKAQPKPEAKADVIKVEVWFGGGERSIFMDLDYERTETTDGIIVTVDRPSFTDSILGPDDLEFDVRWCIEEETKKKIVEFNWM